MDYIDIYETMLGLVEEDAQIPGVENAFMEGSLCASRYEEMRESYQRICAQLGDAEENRDLDEILGCMEDIQRELCERMYRLGLELGKIS